MWYFCDVFGRIWQSPFILFYLLAFWIAPAFLHPQCLDFKPPFQPQQELQFCQMYKYFGCCDYARDQELMAKYYRIMDNFDYYGYSNCASYVQDLLCQVSLVDCNLKLLRNELEMFFCLLLVNVFEPLYVRLPTRSLPQFAAITNCKRWFFPSRLPASVAIELKYSCLVRGQMRSLVITRNLFWPV